MKIDCLDDISVIDFSVHIFLFYNVPVIPSVQCECASIFIGHKSAAGSKQIKYFSKSMHSINKMLILIFAHDSI